MAYEIKPGQGTIFKNSRKEKDTHPEYTGRIKTPDGEEWDLSLWVKKGNKGSFFSVSVKEPYVKPDSYDKAAREFDEEFGIPF